MANFAALASDIGEHVCVEIEVTPVALGCPTIASLGTADVDQMFVSRGNLSVPDWRELSKTEAMRFVAFDIGHDLAYSNLELRPDQECSALCAAIFSQVGEEARFFTTHTREMPESVSYGFSPIRPDWTYSVAYVLVDTQSFLAVCFFAED